MSRLIKLIIFAKTLDGGTGTYVLELLDLQKELDGKYKKKILILEKPNFRKVDQSKFSFWANQNYYPEKYKFTPSNLIKFISEIFWLKRHIDEFKPNIILTVDSHTLLLTGFLKLISGNKIPTVSTIHNNLKDVLKIKSTPFLGKILYYIIRFFLVRSNYLVCVGNDLAEGLKDYFKLDKKPISIYNGLSIKAAKKYKEYSPTSKIILSIGRLSEQKDYSTLLKAFSIFQKEVHSATLLIVGDGPEKAKIKKMAVDCNISSHVKFLGWVQNPTKIIRDADLFVLSTKREGLPYVLVEAMSQGIPTVSSDVKFGPSEILGNGKYGKLVPPNNPIEMAKAFKEILGSERIYNQYAKSALVRSGYFSKGKMLKNYKDLLLKALEKSTRKVYE